MRDYNRASEERISHVSDVEYKLLCLHLLLYPVIGLVITTLFNSRFSAYAFFAVCVFITIAFIAIIFFISNKIYAKHKTQGKIGESVSNVFKYFEPDESGVCLDDNSIVPESVTEEY